MTEDQFYTIGEWQSKTHPTSTPLSMISHLQEEVKELKADLINRNEAIRLEFADCFILLFGIAYKKGMTYEGITNAIEEKMSINNKRVWGKPNELGVINHIK